MKKHITIIALFISLHGYANPDYILNIWIEKNKDNKVEYSMAGATGDGTEVSEKEIIKKAKKVYKLDKELAIHILVNEQISLVDIFKLCKILEKGKLKNFVVTVFLSDVKGFKKYESSEIKHIRFIVSEGKEHIPEPPELPKL